jgi:hypothetical protein
MLDDKLMYSLNRKIFAYINYPIDKIDPTTLDRLQYFLTVPSSNPTISAPVEYATFHVHRLITAEYLILVDNGVNNRHIHYSD